MKLKRIAAALTLAAAAASSAALAQDASRIVAEHRAWTVYIYENGGERTCFISSPPQNSRGAEGRRRGPIAIYVSNHVDARAKDEVSVAVGYPVRGGTASLAVGGRTYTLTTEGEPNGETVWNNGDEAAIIAGMKARSTLTVSATSTGGTNTVDTFSLLGFTNAYNRLNAECPI